MKARLIEGGRLQYVTCTVTYQDAGSDIELFLMSENAKIVDWLVDVTTPFTAGTTLDIGVSGNTNAMVNALDVTSAGRRPLGSALVGPVYDIGDKRKMVVAVLNGSPTAGEMKLTAVFRTATSTMLGG